MPVVRRKVLFISDAGQALQLRKIILKICDVCVNGIDESPTYPSTLINVLRGLLRGTQKQINSSLKYVIYSKQYFLFLKRDSPIK